MAKIKQNKAQSAKQPKVNDYTTIPRPTVHPPVTFVNFSQFFISRVCRKKLKRKPNPHRRPVGRGCSDRFYCSLPFRRCSPTTRTSMAVSLPNRPPANFYNKPARCRTLRWRGPKRCRPERVDISGPRSMCPFMWIKRVRRWNRTRHLYAMLALWRGISWWIDAWQLSWLCWRRRRLWSIS